MSQTTKAPVAPANTMEAWGKFLFPVRGVLGIVFLILLIFAVGPRQENALLNWSIGLAFLLFGEGMRLVSRRFIGRSSSTRKVKVSRLVTGGPYRFVRHPIYVGNIAIVAGFGAMSGFWWTVAVFIPLLFIQYFLIASFETRLVLTRYPEEGSAFVSSVPAWLPNFSAPAVEPSDAWPWQEVLHREGKTLWGIGIGILFLLARDLGWIPFNLFA